MAAVGGPVFGDMVALLPLGYASATPGVTPNPPSIRQQHLRIAGLPFPQPMV
jgi:hypothetical protein